MAQNGADGNGRGWIWRAVLGFFMGSTATMALTGSMSYAAFWRDTPTRVETKQLIQENSPYVQDKKALTQQLERFEKQLDELRTLLGILQQKALGEHAGSSSP